MGRAISGQKYSIEGYTPWSEAIYLGKKFKKRSLHLFLVGITPLPNPYDPWVIECKEYEINEGKLSTYSTKLDFPKLSNLEKEYLKDLAKKYWG